METETASRDRVPAEAEENTELYAEQIEKISEIDTEVPGTYKLKRFMNKLTFNIFLKKIRIHGKKIKLANRFSNVVPTLPLFKICSCYVDEKMTVTRATSDETDDDYSDDDTESDDTDVDNYTESRVTTTTGR